MDKEQYEQILSELNYYQKLLEDIDKRIVNLRQTKQDLLDFEKEEGDDFLASIAAGVFVESKLKNKDLFVNVGSDVVVKKSVAEVIDLIDKKEKLFLEDHKKISRTLEEYYSLLEKKGD